VRSGAKPLFVDIDESGNLDLVDARKRMTSHTKAMVFVHLYGQMGDPQAVIEFCQQHGLLLIEDAAQALGATYRGQPAGSLGLASCLSFDPTKVVAAPGSGGMVLCDDDLLCARIRSLRYHGKQVGGEFEHFGYNSQMSSLTAAILSLKLKRAEDYLARRRQIAARYHACLPRELRLPHELPDSMHIYHKYVIRHSCRDALAEHLRSCGVGCAIHYARPLHREPMMRSFVKAGSTWPRAEAASREVLSLPIHPYLTDDEVAHVIRSARQFISGRQRAA
jgi:dTDP-4-amino-4,6-dideoxygalactose transaminase